MSKSDKERSNDIYLTTIYIDEDAVMYTKKQLNEYVYKLKELTYEYKRNPGKRKIYQPIRRIEIRSKRPVQLTIW